MRCLFRLTSLSACAVVLLAGAGGRALAGGGGGAANNHLLRLSQEHGFTFSEIGDPGNPSIKTRLAGGPTFLTTPRGGVDFRYRIMTREVTVGQYLEFASAVGPYLEQLGFGGFHVGAESLDYVRVGGVYHFSLSPAVGADEPMRTSFAGTVMFANWLHNDKGTSIEAFQNGAYETATFRPVPGDLVPRGQETHNDGARYWIPTTDEWLKAGHWDPNRYGEDEGGWWEQPNSSDTQLIPGRPELGGQTNGGTNAEWPQGQVRPLDGGLYPDMQSPWGLLDVSGGAAEWTETLFRPTNLLSNLRIIDGSESRATTGLNFDDVALLGADTSGALYGIRLATVVPSPGGAAVLAGCLSAFIAFRRRASCSERTKEEDCSRRSSLPVEQQPHLRPARAAR